MKSVTPHKNMSEEVQDQDFTVGQQLLTRFNSIKLRGAIQNHSRDISMAAFLVCAWVIIATYIEAKYTCWRWGTEPQTAQNQNVASATGFVLKKIV